MVQKGLTPYNDRTHSTEEHTMRVHRFLISLVVAAALLAPGLAAAQVRATAKVGPVTVRVYDRAHKDYHDWNDQEDQAYRSYLTNNHRTYRPIAKQSRSQQTKYWNSRHADGRK
jgi:hypothetical protein